MDNIPVKPFNSRKQNQLKKVDPKQYQAIQKQARLIMPELTPEQRAQSFDEVETGFENADAVAEAARCLECGCQANTGCDLRDYATEYKAAQEYPAFNIDIQTDEAWQ